MTRGFCGRAKVVSAGSVDLSTVVRLRSNRRCRFQHSTLLKKVAAPVLKYREILALSAAMLLVAATTGSAFSQSSAVRSRATARDLGPADGARPISVTIP